MKAIILAAGQGSRLAPLTLDKPKCLVEFGGKPLLEWQIDALSKSGINQIEIVLGYKANRVIEKYASFFSKIHINHDFQTSNMLSSLFIALKDMNDDVVISYSDIIYSQTWIKKLLDTNSNINLAIDLDWLKLWKKRFINPLDDAESLRYNPNDFSLEEIGSKVKSEDMIMGQYMGLFRFNQKGISEVTQFYNSLKLSQPVQNMSMTEFFSCMLKNNRPIKITAGYGKWIEIDSISDLETYTKCANENDELLSFTKQDFK